MQLHLRPDVFVLHEELPAVELIATVVGGRYVRTHVDREIEPWLRSLGCPLALLITMDRSWLLRATHEGSETIGEWPTVDLFDLDEPIRSQHKTIVQLHEWLETLANGRPDWRARGSAREDIARHVLPAVLAGHVYWRRPAT